MSENKYEKGKIYKIVSDQTEKIYIGSTCNTLSARLSGHRNDYKSYLQQKQRYTTSFELIKLGDAKIILIEKYPCNDKDELRQREEHWRQLFQNDCVNKCSAFGLSVEAKLKHRDIQKKWQSEHRDYLNEKQKKFRLNNVDKVKTYKKKYYENNKEKVSEYKRKYNEAHKEELKIQKQKRCICCDCGESVQKCKLNRHKSSKKHLAKVAELNKI